MPGPGDIAADGAELRLGLRPPSESESRLAHHLRQLEHASSSPSQRIFLSRSGASTACSRRVSVSSKPSPLSAMLFKCALCAIPLTAGMTVPISGALNAAGRRVCGSVFFTVGVVYTLDWIISGIWAHFTSTATLADNYHAVGHFAFGRPLRWMCLTGGLMGAIQNVISAIVSTLSGTSIYTLGCLLGAVVTSIFLDLTGYCWATKSVPSLYVYVGATAVAAGAIVHSLPSFQGEQQVSRNAQVLCLVISFLSGILVCLQACAGNKLASLCGGFRRAAAWSFFSGAVVLHFIGPYVYPDAPLRTLLLPHNWWRMAQAPLVAYSLVCVAVSQRWLSGAMVYCWFIIGQLVTSTTLDTLGWLGIEARPIDTYKLAGLLVVLAGVLLVTFAKMRTASGAAKVEALAHAEETPLTDDSAMFNVQ
eukprot:Gregarina_sp_Pseudo_9__5611@NODE_76_length_4572_cov_104_792632_g70_i0_p2_GENE_NODE_76_length_4572_cov_104_792632_g70_i0NODE_76_length_4572_cov_104_792632_g70_i0_p2_ORF_typecomplete_len420_score119_53DMT_YdcZ/PF04657_13/1_9e11DMT_YdcZ/PF04657_13/3_2e16_NODE_76_length_4572_cov_104_792632_g70_i023893648